MHLAGELPLAFAGGLEEPERAAELRRAGIDGGGSAGGPPVAVAAFARTQRRAVPPRTRRRRGTCAGPGTRCFAPSGSREPASGAVARPCLDPLSGPAGGCRPARRAAARRARAAVCTLTDGTTVMTVRPRDVPLYVESGVVDLGFVGKDVLLEQGRDVCELLDLRLAPGRLDVRRGTAARRLVCAGSVGCAWRPRTRVPRAGTSSAAVVRPRSLPLHEAAEMGATTRIGGRRREPCEERRHAARQRLGRA